MSQTFRHGRRRRSRQRRRSSSSPIRRNPVADAVAALTELDGFTLIPAPDEAIRDRYFDTPDGRLGSATRSGCGERRLAAARHDQGAGRGPGPTSASAASSTRSRGPTAPGRCSAPSSARPSASRLRLPASDPVRALEALGLVVVQARTTDRRVRAVLPRSGARAQACAELAIDAVVFDLDGLRRRHYELELEAKAPRPATPRRRRSSDGLLARFGAEPATVAPRQALDRQGARER